MKITYDGIELDCHKKYPTLTPKQKDAICNGCGPAGWKMGIFLNNIYGLSIKEICNIHDVDFHTYTSSKGFNIANDRLHDNLTAYCNAKSANWFMRFLRGRRIKKMVFFVESPLGWAAFNA